MKQTPEAFFYEHAGYSYKPGVEDRWNVVAFDINWEDPALYCDHCSKRIESAYVDDEVDTRVN